MNEGKILIFAHEDYEDKELWYPHLRLQEAGYDIDVAGPEAGKVYYGKHGLEVEADLSFDQVNVDDYVGLVIPGGWAPDKLRQDADVLQIVKDADRKGLMIASICHGGQVLVSADIVDGRKVTSYRAVKDDLEFAGANWVDEAVVVDGNLVSSRVPDDLPQFLPAMLEVLEG